MTSFLEHIDDATLSITQKISDVIDQNFGVDHWSIALGMLRVGMAGVLLSIALNLGSDSPGPLSYGIMLLLGLVWIFSYIMLRDRLMAQRASSDAGRALRVSERKTRIIDLVIAVVISLLQFPDVGISEGIFIAGIVAFHLHYHFKAAEMPPPSTSGKTVWST